MVDKIVSQPDHGDSIIQVINGQGVASPRLQLFFDDITRLLSDAGGGGTIEPSDFDASSVLYKTSDGASILSAFIGESEFLGRLPGGEIEGLGFVDAWSILGNGTTNVTINNAGGPNDFTVESNSSSRMLVVQGSANRISVSPIGLAGTDGTFHILNKGAGVVQAASDGDTLVLEDEFEGGMSILNGSNSTGNLYFGGPAYGEKAGNLWFWHDTDTTLPRMGIDVREKTYLEVIDTQGALFNPDQDTDIDFQINTLGTAPFLFIDAAADRMGLTDSSILPTDGLFHIIQGGLGGVVTASTLANALVIESNTSTGLSIITPTAGEFAAIYFGNTTHVNDGAITFNGSTQRMQFRADALERLRLDPVEAVFNEGLLDCDFRVRGLSNSNLIFADAQDNKVFIGTNSRAGTFTFDPGLAQEIISTTNGLTSAAHLLIRRFDTNTVPSTNADDFVIEFRDQGGMTMLTHAAGVCNIYMGNPTSATACRLAYNPAISSFLIFAGDTQIAKFSPTETSLNSFPSNGVDTRVNSVNSTSMIFADASADLVSISDASIDGTDGLLHLIQTGLAGTVTANVLADGVVVESNTDGGISILVPNDGSTANLYFGAPTSGNNVGRVSMVPSTGIMTITATQVNHSNNVGFAGRLDANTTTVTGTTHTAADEHVILVDDDTAAAAVTVTLPTAATADTIYHIKKIGSTANVTVDGNGAETIDGATTAVLTTQYESITIISDGSAWWIL